MRSISALLGLIFGLVFIGASIALSLETIVPTYRSWQTMKNWQSTNNTSVLSLSNTAKNIKTKYQYEVDGVRYQNNRIAVATFNDNIGSYQKDIYHSIKHKHNNKSPITIWYDPLNPSRSVIDRQMRWGLFALMTGFCAVFAVIGLLVCSASLKTSKNRSNKRSKPSLSQLKKQWKQAQKNADLPESFFEFLQKKQQDYEVKKKDVPQEQHLNPKPWLKRKQWQTNNIRSGAKTGVYVMWGFAIVWNGISAPILIALKDEVTQGNQLALIGLLFPLIGLFIIRQAWKVTQEWRHYGVIELVMDPFPGSIGGNVGGSLQIQNVRGFTNKYKVNLECVYSYTSGTGDNRSKRETIKWAETGYAKVAGAFNGQKLTFRFDIPDDLPESSVERGDSYYFWRLKVVSESNAVKLDRSYDIPVFKTAIKSQSVRHDISAQSEEIREEKAQLSQAAISRGDFSSTALKRSVRYHSQGGRHVFYYPMFRNKFLTAISLVFAIGFGFAAFSINGSLSDGGYMAIGMLIFSAPFAITALFATIASIYLPLNNLTVILVERKIKVIRRLFFLPVKKASIGAADIKKIEIKSTGSMGDGVNQVKHFKLIAHTQGFKKTTIAEDIDGEVVANQLKAFICKHLLIDFD